MNTTMGSSIWILSFVEDCLSSYETGSKPRSDPNLTWENDGSNLRFHVSIECRALINSWNERTDVLIANVTDSETQINAILARESLDNYAETFPQRPLSKEGCRGHYIQLSDFELVYEYSTGKPKLHLYVKRFSIAWERDKIRAPPQGKLAHKKHEVIRWMDRVITLIKARDQQNEKPATVIENNDLSARGLASQAINGHTNHTAQTQLMSQFPTVPSTIPDPTHGLEYDAAPSGELLARLAPSRASSSRHSSREGSTKIQSLPRLPSGVSRPSRGVSQVSASHNGRSATPQGERQNAPARDELVVVDEAANPGPISPKPTQNRSLPQEVAEEALPYAHIEKSSPEKVIERPNSPYSPEKQLNAQLEACHPVQIRPKNPTDTVPGIIDPWEGMTEIRSIDVTVPKDQEELFSHDRKLWYPPDVGVASVSGHVPPALLDEWNRLAAQEIRKIEDDKAKVPEDDDNNDSTDRRTPVSEGDSSSEGEPFDWDQSPERTPRRDVYFPPDTPQRRSVSPQVLQRQNPSYRDSRAETQDREPQEEHENDLVSEKGQNRSPTSTRPSPEVEKNERSEAIEPIAPDITHSHHHDDEDESDNSSSDESMSIAIPQPLSGSTQQNGSTQGLSSQPIAEVSSSGPPLPEPTTQHIQAVETPASAFDKSHSTMSTTEDGFRAGLHNTEPSVDKSSSQSRILNTYASHDTTTGKSSQESSKFISTSEPANSNRVHVMGTPMSSGALQTQDQVSCSRLNSPWTSSGPMSTDPNVLDPGTYQSQLSNALSDYREVPQSSMLSVEEHRSPSIQSSVHGTPLRRARSFPLKRLATELDDSEHGSPSKRTKFDRKPLVPELTTGPEQATGLGNMRLSFFMSLKAENIFHKFKGHYPNYAGDFAHFTKMCSRLQAFQKGGNLQRSRFWDDFVIKHLEDYPTYLGDCLANETKSLSYEDYFLSSFSKPTYPRRSLEAPDIATCAAQIVDVDETASPILMTDSKVSFTGSLREKLSNLRTHSFAPTHDSLTNDEESEPQDTQGDAESSRSQSSIPDSEPDRVAQGDLDMHNEWSPERNFPDVETTRADSEGLPDADMDLNDSASQQFFDDEMDMDDTGHERASVELGDDEPPVPVQAPVQAPVLFTAPSPIRNKIIPEPAIEQPPSQPTPPKQQLALPIVEDQIRNSTSVDLEPEPERELENSTKGLEPAPEDESESEEEKSENELENPDNELAEQEEEKEEEETENWFTSLRHIYPTTPVWSDDKNTPFKQWARADQNVFSARSRRGGGNAFFDERGVVQPRPSGMDEVEWAGLEWVD
ncbi:hypothetical protein BJX99DRAFT_162681 [Aspergillus californicus]